MNVYCESLNLDSLTKPTFPSPTPYTHSHTLYKHSYTYNTFLLSPFHCTFSPQPSRGIRYSEVTSIHFVQFSRKSLEV